MSSATSYKRGPLESNLFNKVCHLQKLVSISAADTLELNDTKIIVLKSSLIPLILVSNVAKTATI